MYLNLNRIYINYSNTHYDAFRCNAKCSVLSNTHLVLGIIIDYSFEFPLDLIGQIFLRCLSG